MASSSDTVLHLRQLLAERFGPGFSPEEKNFVTGLPVLDERGVPQGALTEIVSNASTGPGGSLLLYALLHAAIRGGQPVMLIDGKEAFAPKGLPPSDLNRLLWLRCRNAGQVIKAADLAIRDGNIPLVILLLTVNPPGELRKILAEKSAVTVFVFSPDAQVGCARLRLTVGGSFPLEKLHGTRAGLLPSLSLRVERRKTGRGRGCDDEELCRPACA
jgi:hypothetical protein